MYLIIILLLIPVNPPCINGVVVLKCFLSQYRASSNAAHQVTHSLVVST